VLADSWQIELPPYWQDLSVGGRGISKGWLFVNSINTELATGGDNEGKPSMEIGASMNEMDYLHVINWARAEQLVKSGSPKIVVRNGIRVIPLEVARDEGLLYFVPESKSPHGCDLAPGGEYIIVSGKLDPHVTAYSFEKIKKAIEQKNFEKNDPTGSPSSVRRRSRGLRRGRARPAPQRLRRQGNGYTSLFLDSAVAKFTLGPPYHTGDDAWKLVTRSASITTSVTSRRSARTPPTREGATSSRSQVGRRQAPGVGPLHPQKPPADRHQRDKMRLLSETPVIGEPHNSMIIEMDKVAAWSVYPPGTDPNTMLPSPNATKQGEEGIERKDGVVHVHATVIRSQYKPTSFAASRATT